MTTEISVSGMHCASCKALIEDVSRDVSGVISCSVDPRTGRGVVEHDAAFRLPDLARAVAELGDYRIVSV